MRVWKLRTIHQSSCQFAISLFESIAVVFTFKVTDMLQNQAIARRSTLMDFIFVITLLVLKINFVVSLYSTQ